MKHGWICPKCGAVYSPSTTQCAPCNAQNIGCGQPDEKYEIKVKEVQSGVGGGNLPGPYDTVKFKSYDALEVACGPSIHVCQTCGQTPDPGTGKCGCLEDYSDMAIVPKYASEVYSMNSALSAKTSVAAPSTGTEWYQKYILGKQAKQGDANAKGATDNYWYNNYAQQADKYLKKLEEPCIIKVKPVSDFEPPNSPPNPNATSNTGSDILKLCNDAMIEASGKYVFPAKPTNVTISSSNDLDGPISTFTNDVLDGDGDS